MWSLDDGCRRYHNRILHEKDSSSVLSNNKDDQAPVSNDNGNNVEKQACLSCHTKDESIKCSKIVFKVVPIEIYASNKSIKSYALLDECSEVSLIDEELAGELGLESNSEQTLNLKWFSNVSSKC